MPHKKMEKKNAKCEFNNDVYMKCTKYGIHYLLLIEVEGGIDIYGSVESGARDWSINVNSPRDWGE